MTSLWPFSWFVSTSSKPPFLELIGQFSSAIEALGFINQHEVQLIFMDIQMPDLSGMELARVLDGKKDSDQTRIIFCDRLSSVCHRGIQG